MSAVVFFPNVRSVSIQITGKINKLITGKNTKNIHHFGRFMICIKTIPLYTGTKASQAFLPAFTYNFHVQIACSVLIINSVIIQDVISIVSYLYLFCKS